MPDRIPALIDARAERALTDELARMILADVAPEEMPLYELTAEEYFADPRAVLAPPDRDEALGFGLELAMLTPFVILVAQKVLQSLATAVAESAVERAATSMTGYLRQLLGLGNRSPAQQPVALTREQAARVREVARATAITAGVNEATAALIADATVGALATGR